MNPDTSIVLLNGVGSVGKSSIACALQRITIVPFLHVPMDAFFEMLPASLIGHPDGIVLETGEQDGRPSVAIRTGPLAARVFRGMRHAIAAMAEQGNNMIVDDVMLHAEMAEYESLLAEFTLYRVGVFAPLDVIEARERTRGDRLIGLARWQYSRVHQQARYDLELDAASRTPAECAMAIKEKFAL